jgi:hypothetical protein
MEARGLRVIRLLDLRAACRQPIERFPFGGSGEHGRDHTKGPALSTMCPELIGQESQPTPSYEGAQKVDRIGGRDLVSQSVGEARLSACVNQEV